MHTAIMVGCGLVALAVFLLSAAALGKSAAAGARFFFLPWLAASLGNLYVGVTHGHSVIGELPFLAIVFGVPALVAYAVMRWSTAGGAAPS